MIHEIQRAYYPNIFFSKVRKTTKNKDKDIFSAKTKKIAEGYNSKGMKEYSYSSEFDVKI